MKENQYIPSEDELRRAEARMSPEEVVASHIRAQNWEQEQAPWASFEDDNIDVHFERKPPKPEQIEKMNRSLAELSDAFTNSNLNWHLDGALNISLLTGKYIGNHKDVDVSVEKSELAKLDAELIKKGYGLFLSRTKENTTTKVVRRVGHADFNETSTEHLLLGAIDKDGKIRRDAPLNFVDVHIIDRNEKGQALGSAGVVIPDKWTKPYPIEFKGKQINLSHPGKVLYYKLHQGRNYDATDIQRLIETGKVTEEDVDEVAVCFEKEFTANRERARQIFGEIAAKLTSTRDTEQVYKIVMQHPEFKKGGEEMRAPTLAFAERIFSNGDFMADTITNIAIDFFKFEEKNTAKREEIKRIRQSVTDIQKIKQIKEKL